MAHSFLGAVGILILIPFSILFGYPLYVGFQKLNIQSELYHGYIDSRSLEFFIFHQRFGSTKPKKEEEE
ncbi:hypothetical protein [Rubritalea tangerina]|uniref:hypothetical protein n=1 Tax=Rubritalea tangerina TaxID=430798 RepID=UPI003618C7FC